MSWILSLSSLSNIFRILENLFDTVQPVFKNSQLRAATTLLMTANAGHEHPTRAMNTQRRSQKPTKTQRRPRTPNAVHENSMQAN